MTTADLLDLALTETAIEHALWAAGDGQTPRDVLASVGLAWPRLAEPTWHDAVAGLRIAARRLVAAPPRRVRTPFEAPLTLRKVA